MKSSKFIVLLIAIMLVAPMSAFSKSRSSSRSPSSARAEGLRMERSGTASTVPRAVGFSRSQAPTCSTHVARSRASLK